MKEIDELELSNTICKANTWLSKAMEQLGCSAPVDVTSVQCKKSSNLKDKLAILVSESFHLVRFQNETLKTLKAAFSETKRQLIENQKCVINLQKQVIDCKEEQLQAVKTSVEKTVKEELKSYSDAVQENVMVCQSEGVNSETLKSVIKTVVEEEDRSKNVMVFGLEEAKNEDLSKQVEGLFEEIGLKPKMELSRVGKKGNEKLRPVRVLFFKLKHR